MPLRTLSAPVALFSLNTDDAVLEELTDSFAAALGLEPEHVGLGVTDIFGQAATGLFREGLEAAMAGRSRSLRIQLTHGDKTRSRIFLFQPGESGHAGGRFLVALERRARSIAPQNAFVAESNEAAAERLTALNGHMFFAHDVMTGNSQFLNLTMARTLDLPDTGLDARRLMRCLHPEDLASFRACVRALPEIADGQVLTLSLRVRDRNRKWRSLLVRIGIATRDQTGGIRCLTGVAEDFTDHEALSGALQSASQAVHDVETRERRRIARELHDSTAQHLVAIDLGLSALSPAIVRDEESKTLTQIRRSLAAAHKEIRSFSYLLHPPQVAENGLKAALSAYLEGFGARAGLVIETVFSGPLDTLPPDIERTLFRVAQEALMNVHRHASASRVQVSLEVAAGIVRIDITDNGTGLAPGAHEGVGLSGMRARMKQVGGDITFDNQGEGFVLRARCPFRPVVFAKD
jgi:signal transduction histidine kinase